MRLDQTARSAINDGTYTYVNVNRDQFSLKCQYIRLPRILIID